jgi:hypothetical protein
MDHARRFIREKTAPPRERLADLDSDLADL